MRRHQDEYRRRRLRPPYPFTAGGAIEGDFLDRFAGSCAHQGGTVMAARSKKQSGPSQGAAPGARMPSVKIKKKKQKKTSRGK
jgi:hypothetical protein